MASDAPSAELLAVLAACMSSDMNERQAAEAFLTQHELQQGFQNELLRVVAERSLPETVRQQAAIFFKNSVERHWHKRGPNSITVSDKQLIRAKLLILLDEPYQPILGELAVSFGKLARADYPKDWPELVDTLLAKAQQALQGASNSSGARASLYRSLFVFKRVVKSLSSNRSRLGKRILTELCYRTMVPLRQLYEHYYQASVASLGSLSPDASAQPHDIEISLLLLKILAALVIYAWGGGTPVNEEEVAANKQLEEQQREFCVASLPHYQTLYSLRRQRAVSGHLSEGAYLKALNKHVAAYVKLYTHLVRNNHLAFHSIGITHDACNLLWTHIYEVAQDVQALGTADEPAAADLQVFAVKELLLFRDCFVRWPMYMANWHDPDLAAQVLDIIVSRLLPLRAADLERWQNEPEEWFKQQTDAQWQYDLRPAAETFLFDIVKKYTAEVGPRLVRYMQQLAPATSLDQVLLKESVYTAVGQSANELSEFVPFEAWLDSHLIPDATSEDPNLRIIRRRVVWLMEKWVGIQTTPAISAKVNNVVCHLLRDLPGNDLATRLTAASALGGLDVWIDEKEHLLPILPQLMQDLPQLLRQLEETETRRHVINTLGHTITRAGKDIRPYLEHLVQMLPAIFEEAAEQNIVQNEIVATMQKLLDALGSDSEIIHGICCQFIRISCSAESPSHVFLREDGIALWTSLIATTTSPTQDIMSLIPLAIHLLSEGSDTIVHVLRVVESYILLAPETVLAQHVGNLMHALVTLLNSLDDRATKSILYTVDMILRSGASSVWAAALDSSDLVAKILNVIMSDASAVQITRYLCTLARIAIADTPVFHDLLRSAVSKGPLASDPHGYEEAMRRLVAGFVDRYDNQPYAARRKLVTIALTCLVRTTDPVILDRFDEIVGCWLSALSATQESPAGEYVESSTAIGSSRMQPSSPPSAAFDEGRSASTTPSLGFSPTPTVTYPHSSPWESEEDGMATDGKRAWPASPSENGKCDPVREYFEGFATGTARTSASHPGGVVDQVNEQQHGNGMDDGADQAVDSFNYADEPTFADDSADEYYNDDEPLYPVEMGWGEIVNYETEVVTPGMLRQNDLIRRDVVHTTKLTAIISAAIADCQQINGGPEAFSQKVLAGVEPKILQELEAYLTGAAQGGD